MAADSPLADAAMARDAAAVRALLAKKADVNAPQGDGSTALHWAVYNGDVELTRLLLGAGADAKAQTRLGGLTPVMMAARAGDAPALRLLLDAKGDAVTANANGTTPLMFAAASGNVDAVTLLVDRGADVNAADRTHGQTPLMFAAAQGRDAAVKVLLARKADPNAATQVSKIITMGERYKAKTEGKGTREITSEGGRSDITAMGGMTALMFAAREGHVAAVRALVEGGADVNKVQGADELSPITLAIVNGRLDIAAYLLEHGANPNLVAKNGVGPLWATVDARWPERTWYPPANITEEKTTHLDLLQALLAKGADPNARIVRKPWYRTFHGDWADPVGATPFWLAAKANDVEAMRLLVAGGANPSIPSGRGVTAAAGGRRLRHRAAGDQLQAQRAARGGALSRRGAERRRQRPRQPGLHAAPRRGAHRRSRAHLLPGGDGRRRRGAGHQHLRRREPGRPRRRARQGRHGGRHGQRPARAQHAVPGDGGLPRRAGLGQLEQLPLRDLRGADAAHRQEAVTADAPLPMPIYEYRCRACDRTFEALVRGGDTPACPACAATDLERLVSLFAVDSDGTRQAARSTSMAKGVKRQQDKEVADVELYKRHHH